MAQITPFIARNHFWPSYPHGLRGLSANSTTRMNLQVPPFGGSAPAGTGLLAVRGRGLAFSGLTKNIKILVRRPQKGRFGTEAEEESLTDGTATWQLTTRLGCPPDLCWLSPESSPTGTGKSKSDGVNRWLRIWCTLTHILHEPVSGPGISRRGIWPQSIQQSHGQYCTETSTGIHEVGKRLLPELNI